MTNRSIIRGALPLALLCVSAFGAFAPLSLAEDASRPAIAELEKALDAAKEGSSEARQRLAVRRVIRDAETLLGSKADSPERFPVLGFLFRAQQQLIAIDGDSAHRKALLETCRELVEAPDEFAEFRMEADLLLSQADLAKQGANAEVRAEALRPFVNRYLETPVAGKVLRLAMVMALELGDSRLVTDLQEMIGERFASDLEMIAFQRDKLGGQVFGAPFTGTFERSDGKTLRFPMDGLGRSTMLVFWSKDAGGEELLKGLASAALEMGAQLAGRLEIISFNLDGLPDAGESFVRGLGVDWQVLRLPDGRKNPIYDAYVRSDPRILTVSPTGYTALIMSGTTRQKENTGGEPDYGRMFGSALAREWTEPRYVMQLASLYAGDFLVCDPEGAIDPTRPPELKSLAKGADTPPLKRSAGSVPEETLLEIQKCFIPPPRRYRMGHDESRASYGKAVALCRKALTDHASAPDLWIIRNRLIVALLGLWKTDADLGRLEEAIAEAKAAMAAGYPTGCDVVARFCLAREALRDSAANPRDVFAKLLGGEGDSAPSGPELAAASLLALDVADRKSFEDCRKAILKDHTEYPMMWVFTSFLLDRHHDYWLFQVPFTAGWSYGRREGYFQTKGDAEEAQRVLRTEFANLDGGSLRVPEDLGSEWTMVLFSPPAPWASKRDDGLPPPPDRVLKSCVDFASARAERDVEVLLAVLDGDASPTREALEQKNIDCQVVSLPSGMDNPLIQRLGILSEDKGTNAVLIRRDGRIAVAASGLISGNRTADIMINVVTREDEKFVSAALERGDVEAAKKKILSLAPPFDPEAVDERGHKLKKPAFSLAHLRARARVYIALKDWAAAMADAEEVVGRLTEIGGAMSMRPEALNEAEEFLGTIRKMQDEAKR